MRHRLIPVVMTAGCFLALLGVVDEAVGQAVGQKTQAISELAKALRTRYVTLDVGQKAAQFLEQRLLDGAYEGKEGQAFADIVTADLQAVTKDRHLRFGFADPSAARPAAPLSDPAAERAAEQAEMRRNNYGFARLEIFPGNLGYLDIRRFMAPDVSVDTLVGAMAFLANSDVLIIDVRNCTGGSAHMMPFFAAYFFSQPTSLFDMEFRADNFTERFWTLPWVPGKRLSAPMYILTSARTFSGAEGFAYRFQVLKRAIIVGETTGGGANAGGVLDIPPSFRVWMPMGRPIDQQTGGNWEGTGVVPDIKVAARDAIVTARLHALRRLRAEARTETDRRRLDWALERTEAARFPTYPRPAQLESYSGTYGGARVWVEGGQLRYRAPNEQTVLLTPLTASVFATELSDPLRLEFVSGVQGRFDRLLVTGEDFIQTELSRQLP